MKKLLSLLAILTIAFGAANAAINYGYNSNEIPEDYQNDLWVNKDYVELAKGETFEIWARRLPEIMESDVSTSEAILPTFHYTLVEGKNISINEKGIITANELGRAVIEITYDEKEAFGKKFGACSEINKTYIVVNVIDKTADNGITIKTDIAQGHYDTYYYTTGNGFNLTFKATIENATDTVVTLNGDTINIENGKYNALLKNRANILEIEAKNAKGTKRWAQVIDARHINITIENLTKEDQPIFAGDKAKISFKGLTMPVYKLGSIYNPHLNKDKMALVVYKNSKLGTIKTKNPQQYNFSDNNALEITFKEAGEYVFNAGHITESWWGQEIGTDTTVPGRIPNQPAIAPEYSGEFSKLPAFRINVRPAINAETKINTFDIDKAIKKSDVKFNENDVWAETTNDSSIFRLISDGNITLSHLSSGNSWGGMSWDGFTISKSKDNAYDHNEFPTRQWGNTAQGGFDSIGAPYILGYASAFVERACEIKTVSGLATEILGAYINTTAYDLHSLIYGDAYTRRFKAGDYYTLTAHGLDSEGKDNGKKAVFYLADYRDNNSENWFVNTGWEWMDLTSLGKVYGVYFTMESTDVGDFGMNTPQYFAMDKLTYIPSEPLPMGDNEKLEYGYKGNDIPEDYENDLWVNADYVELTTETYQIRPRRVAEIIDDPISNQVTLPKFTYRIVEGLGNVTVSETGLVTPKKIGRSIIEVSYDSIKVNEKIYGGCSEVNKTYVIINVLENANINHGIKITSNIKEGHYDTYYYSVGNGFNYTFSLKAENADNTIVTVNGDTISGKDGIYNAKLLNRANIIEVVASNDKGSKRWAKVIDARKVDINIANATNPEMPFVAGDTAKVSFKGITLPVCKLAKIYNPQMGAWGGKPAVVTYSNDKLGDVKTDKPTQYDLATKNTIVIPLEEAGEYSFKSGHIFEAWWGAGLGTDKYEDGKAPGAGGGIAPTLEDKFSKLPAFRISVRPEFGEEAIIDTFDINTAIEKLDMKFDKNNVWAETMNDTSIYRYINDDKLGLSHLASGNSWGGMSWDGFTISKNTDNEYGHNEFPARQWGCMAQGGIDSIGAPYILGYASAFTEQQGKHACEVKVNSGALSEILGAYVNTTAYDVNAITYGDAYARTFRAGDYYTLTAHGLDTEGNDNGKTVVFYLADYRDADSENWILNTEWEWMDLRGLGKVSSVYFTMESSDMGDYGMNTPQYFAMDKLMFIEGEIESPETSTDLTKSDIRIYPNPCENVLYVDNAEGEMITIYNLQGQVIVTETVGMNGIDVSSLNSGIYVVKCGDKTEKLMIK